MTFRRADEERSRELAKVREADDSRAQLARLAEAGRRRQTAGEEDLRANALAEQQRKVPARFHVRALRSRRVQPFAVAWGLLLLAVAILSATVGGGTGLGLVAWVFVCFLWPLIPGSHWILMRILRVQDATHALTWQRSLPFLMRSYLETLSLDHDLRHLRIRIAFESERPDAAMIEGLLGHIDPPGERLSKVVTGDSKSAIVRDISEDGGVPNHVTEWVHDVVERVLLPVHAAYPIAWAELTEGKAGDDSKYGSDAEALAALLR